MLVVMAMTKIVWKKDITSSPDFPLFLWNYTICAVLGQYV